MRAAAAAHRGQAAGAARHGVGTTKGPGDLNARAALSGRSPWPLPLPTIVYEVITLVLVLAGAAIAYVKYRKDVAVEAPQDVNFLTRAARNSMYDDAINDVLVVQPTYSVSRAFVGIDNKGIDGVVNGLAAFVGGSGERLRRWQSGFARSYALAMVGGAVLVVAVLAVVRPS